MGNSVSMSNLSEDVPFIKPTMADIEKKYNDIPEEEIFENYSRILKEIIQVCENPLTPESKKMQESANVFHEFHLVLQLMYNEIKDAEPEDKDDKKNHEEYCRTFGNMSEFLDIYSSDFTKLMVKKDEMKKLEGLSKQVEKSLHKMNEDMKAVGDAMSNLSDTINETMDELEIPLFVNEMVREKGANYRDWREEEQLLLSLNEAKNHFKALDLSKKPKEELTETEQKFLKLFLKTTVAVKEEDREKVDLLYVEYYKKVKSIYEADKQVELLLNDYKIRQNEAGEEYMKEIDDLKRQQVENEANERE